jgi:hypothetical protein
MFKNYDKSTEIIAKAHCFMEWEAAEYAAELRHDRDLARSSDMGDDYVRHYQAKMNMFNAAECFIEITDEECEFVDNFLDAR